MKTWARPAGREEPARRPGGRARPLARGGGIMAARVGASGPAAAGTSPPTGPVATPGRLRRVGSWLAG